MANDISAIANAHIDFSRMTCSLSLNFAADSVSGVMSPSPAFSTLPEAFRTPVEVQGGYITIPVLAGIGFEDKADLYREMKALSS
ncbi:MAG: hypothetical protein JO313_16775 [Verrucomicrobia bacterium]|nr:hypothetical protein [Verrucomicrobiota bacterium]